MKEDEEFKEYYKEAIKKFKQQVWDTSIPGYITELREIVKLLHKRICKLEERLEDEEDRKNPRSLMP